MIRKDIIKKCLCCKKFINQLGRPNETGFCSACQMKICKRGLKMRMEKGKLKISLLQAQEINSKENLVLNAYNISG